MNKQFQNINSTYSLIVIFTIFIVQFCVYNSYFETVRYNSHEDLQKTTENLLNILKRKKREKYQTLIPLLKTSKFTCNKYSSKNSSILNALDIIPELPYAKSYTKPKNLIWNNILEMYFGRTNEQLFSNYSPPTLNSIESGTQDIIFTMAAGNMIALKYPEL